MNYTLGLVHAPIWEGQKKPGVASGPSKMENLGLNQLLFELGYNFKTYKKPETNEFIYGQPEELEVKYRNVYNLVDRAFNETTLPIVLGGDHSLAMSSISAVLKHHPKTGILWVDAHADINTFETSPSGNLHGMPVAALSGLIPEGDIFNCDWLSNKMSLKQIVYLGLRDIDSGEVKLLKDNKVLYYTADDLRKKNFTDVFKEITQHFETHGYTDGLHLSFDIDALSSELVPATGTPVANGLTIEQMQEMLSLIKKNFKLTSVDCVEFNPYKVDSDEEVLKTYSSIQSFFRSLLTNPRPVINSHLLKKLEKSPVLSHHGSIAR